MNKIPTKATGPVVSQSYDLTGFTGISTSLSGVTNFSQSTDGSFSVEIAAQQSILDIISATISTSNGLTLIFTQNPPDVYDQIVVTISCPELNDIEISGSSDFSSSTNLDTDVLIIDISGSGNIKIPGFDGNTLTVNLVGSGNLTISSGSVSVDEITLVGSGAVALSLLSCRTSVINSTGSGDTYVNVSDTLDVTISGSGNVYYSGNPTMAQNITGTGSIIQQ